MTYVAYAETVNGGGKDAVFDDLTEAWEWVRERLNNGYHSGDVTFAETGDSAPEPKSKD